MRSSTTFASVEPAPIRPTRQILPGERTEAGADLDVESSQQRGAHGRLVDAVGTRTAFSVHSRSPRRQQRDAERLEPGGEREVVAAMARPARLEPFFLDDDERLVQRVDERRRDRVVILAADPVVLEQREIQIEAARRHARLSSARENVIGASPDGAPSPFCVQL